jgi:hypothetical protein
MIYAFEYNVSGIGNHPFSGHHISRLTADNDEDAVERIKGLRNEIMHEFRDLPIEFSITFFYKEVETNKVKELINENSKEVIEIKSSDNIPCDLAKIILNKIIDYVADNEKNEEAAINKLIKIGFTGESLVDYFGFNMMSVSEVLEELHNKENSTS